MLHPGSNARDGEIESHRGLDGEIESHREHPGSSARDHARLVRREETTAQPLAQPASTLHTFAACASDDERRSGCRPHGVACDLGVDQIGAQRAAGPNSLLLWGARPSISPFHTGIDLHRIIHVARTPTRMRHATFGQNRRSNPTAQMQLTLLTPNSVRSGNA